MILDKGWFCFVGGAFGGVWSDVEVFLLGVEAAFDFGPFVPFSTIPMNEYWSIEIRE